MRWSDWLLLLALPLSACGGQSTTTSGPAPNIAPPKEANGQEVPGNPRTPATSHSENRESASEGADPHLPAIEVSPTGPVFFPGLSVEFFVGKPDSLSAFKQAESSDSKEFILLHGDLPIATRARVIRSVSQPDNKVESVIVLLERVEVAERKRDDAGFWTAQVKSLIETEAGPNIAALEKTFLRAMRADPKVPQQMLDNWSLVEMTPEQTLGMIAFNLNNPAANTPREERLRIYGEKDTETAAAFALSHWERMANQMEESQP